MFVGHEGSLIEGRQTEMAFRACLSACVHACVRSRVHACVSAAPSLECSPGYICLACNMRILIAMVGGQTMELDVEASDTIDSVKARMLLAEDQQQRLFFASAELLSQAVLRCLLRKSCLTPSQNI